MISFCRVALSFVALIALVSAVIPVEDGVLVLDDTNFAEASAAHENLLVEFYAPWCGHCKTLAPEWIKAAKALEGSAMKLAKVDATIAKVIAETHAVQGFPTIKYFKNGKSTEYNGGRVESDIVAWVNKKLGPAYVTVATVAELTKLKDAHESFVLGVFAKIDSDSAKKFIAMATESEDLTYAITITAAVKKDLAITKDAVVVLKNFDELRNDMTLEKGFVAADVEAFVSASTIPLVQEFSQEAAKKIFRSAIQQHALLFTDKESSSHAPSLALLSEIAKQFKGKAIFVSVPTTESRVFEFFGITEDQVPAFVVADMGAESGMKKYPYTGAMENAPMAAFMTDFLAGKIEPTLKSQEVVPEDTTGPVMIAKGSSFKDIVINNTKDVLVEFYAPWCGHCKTLSPIWDELGTKFKGNSNIAIVKMDSTENEIDVPGVSVKGFPTIYFFKGDDKANPVKYEEGRELKDFIAYLKENSHNDHDEL